MKQSLTLLLLVYCLLCSFFCITGAGFPAPVIQEDGQEHIQDIITCFNDYLVSMYDDSFFVHLVDLNIDGYPEAIIGRQWGNGWIDRGAVYDFQLQAVREVEFVNGIDSLTKLKNIDTEEFVWLAKTFNVSNTFYSELWCVYRFETGSFTEHEEIIYWEEDDEIYHIYKNNMATLSSKDEIDAVCDQFLSNYIQIEYNVMSKKLGADTYLDFLGNWFYQ